jgi:2-dehydropantoate 2-reductase
VKIAVMGRGGVGGYLGARLAVRGQEVVFIARGEHLRAIRERGLVVHSHYEEFHVNPARATDNPGDVGPVGLVLFCVKTWDTEAAARAVRPMVGPGTAVLSFQNGVDNEEKLAAILGPEHVMGGVAYLMSTVAAPGVIQQSGALTRLVFGEPDGRASPRAQAFLAACQTAGIEAELTAEIQGALWTKFVFLCALGGVTSLVRAPLGPILRDPEARKLFIACMEEVSAVGRARGVRLAADIVQRQLALAEELPPGFTSSMHKDLERGGRLELDSLAGAVVRLGRELEMDTPVNRFIHAALKLHAEGKVEKR